MAKAAATFIPEILPYAPACPDMAIEANVISAAIKFCEDSKAWQYNMDPMVAVAGLGEYDLEPPAASVVDRIHTVTHNGLPLEPVTMKTMDERVPKRTTYTATPKFYLKNSSTTLLLGPIPAATLSGGLRIRLVLKPVRTATSLNDELYNDYFEAILRLALYRLLSIPGKDWSNPVAAREQLALYDVELRRAKQRARQAEGGFVPIVGYGGL